MAKKKAKVFTLRGFGVADIRDNDLGDTVFETEKQALAFVKSVAKESKPTPQLMKIYMTNFRKHYRIVPIVITYSL